MQKIPAPGSLGATVADVEPSPYIIPLKPCPSPLTLSTHKPTPNNLTTHKII